MRTRRSMAPLVLATVLTGAWGAFGAANRAQAQTAPDKVALSIPNTQWGACVAKLSASLQAVKGVKGVTQFSPQSKRAIVEYDPAMTSVQQLAQVVADTPGVHGKPYQATLLIHVEDLSSPDTKKKIDGAFKDLKGVSAATVDDSAGILGVTFAKLEPSQGTGVQLGQILGALSAAGVKASPFVPPA